MSTKELYPELYERGARLIALGEALQNADTPLTKIVELAIDCGLAFQFRVVPNEQEQKETGG